MSTIEYIGLDIHRKSVSYCRKRADGEVIAEGRVAARADALRQWAVGLPSAWKGAMEATIFTGWIYDVLQPYAAELLVGHPLRMEAVTKAKKKSDRGSASTICDLLRANLLPVCTMLPPELRELRQALRFRNKLVREAVRMHNHCAGLLMMNGVPYKRVKLHRKHYFTSLLEALAEPTPDEDAGGGRAEDVADSLEPWGRLDHVPEAVRGMLAMGRASYEFFEQAQKKLLAGLATHPRISGRVERLKTIPGVGDVTALSWVLEIGPVERFASIGKAWSYCGLTAGQSESGESAKRLPLSKLRNGHLQTVLIEAAKLAPRWNPLLAEVSEREKERGHKNRATIAVARKLVAYLMAVDKREQPFQLEVAKLH
jgi:transposase